jgi:type VI protein secretion system component Hcp
MIESANLQRRTRGTRFHRVRGRTAALYRPGIEPLEGRALLTPLMTLSFAGAAGSPIEVSSFNFTASNTGAAIPGPLTLTFPGSPADPTLLADMFAGTHLATAEVSVFTAAAQPKVYLTYTLSHVKVGSIQTSIDASANNKPVTTITLNWSTLAESYSPIAANGTVGTPVVATWNTADGTVAGAGTPAATSTAPLELGLSFGGPGELDVSSFSFAGSNTGSATPGPLTLTLPGSAADPTLLADMVAGRHLATAQVNVRTLGPTSKLYLTYTLTDAVIGSIQTTIDANTDDKPVTTITLSWAKLTESFAPIQGDGNLGAAVNGSWNALTGTATGVGTPSTSNPDDATSEYSLTQEGYRYDRATGQFVQTITISYLGSTPIVGPLSLSLDELIGGTLAGASTSAGPLTLSGGSFIDLPAIGVGQSLTITLAFDDPSQAPISYDPHFLIG